MIAKEYRPQGTYLAGILVLVGCMALVDCGESASGNAGTVTQKPPTFLQTGTSAPATVEVKVVKVTITAPVTIFGYPIIQGGITITPIQNSPVQFSFLRGKGKFGNGTAQATANTDAGGHASVIIDANRDGADTLMITFAPDIDGVETDPFVFISGRRITYDLEVDGPGP